MCKFFTDIYRFHFTDQDLRLCRNSHAGHLCNLGSLLTNDFRIQCAVDDDRFSNLLDLVAFQEVASSVFKLISDLFVNALQYRH